MRLARFPKRRGAGAGWALAATLAAGAAAAGGGALDDPVGGAFWARPGEVQTSVDFFEEPALRTRVPVRYKTPFRVERRVALGSRLAPADVYEVRFPGGEVRYIAVAEFERELFREPGPGEVVTGFRPPGGEAPEVFLFRRRSIFADDPDAIRERIGDRGPSAFRPAPR